MRTPAVLPIALALVIVVSGLFVFAGPAHAGAVSSPAKASHPLATVSIHATDQYGYYRSEFSVGYSNGVVCFSAFDPSDSQATISIFDTNATRDRLASPVFTYTASFSSSSFNDSWTYGVGYLLPLNLTYGGNWTLQISGTNGGVANFTFFVHSYTVDAFTTQNAYLPGHPGSGFFEVDYTANLGPYPFATVHIAGRYYTSGGTWSPLVTSPSTLTDVARTTFNFTVPLDANTNGEVVFAVFANASTGLSESAFAYAAVGNLSDPVVDIGACPGGCFTSAFTDGSTVYVQIQEDIIGFYTLGAAGVRIVVSFSSGSLPVTVPSVPTNLTTNATGGASFVFLASASIFPTQKIDELTVTASDPLNPSLPTTSTHVFFTVSSVPTATPNVEVRFDSLQYYGGDTATVTWQLGGLNASVSQGWTADEWFLEDYSTGRTLGWGSINSTQSQGQFTFAIPVNYGGEIEAFVWAYNASAWTEGWASALVTAPTILLNPSEVYYLPGDTVTVQVTTEGSIFSGTTLYQSVVESSGYQLASGVLSGSQITFSIPKVGAPNYVTVSVAAQSPTLGIVAANTVEVSEATGFQLFAGISTRSNYADGSFQPGQTIQISYNLQAIGGTTLPKTFNIFIYPGSASYFGSAYGSVYAATTSPSGTVSYTIPSNVPAGAQTFTVVVTSGVCTYTCGAVSSFSALIQPNPSVLGYELGAGSGVTVGWVILLVLILLVAVIAYIALRRGGGRSGGKPPAVKPYSGSAPPSSGSSTPSWKEEGGGSSSSPPPMPQQGPR